MAKYTLDVPKDQPLHEKIKRKIEGRIKLAVTEQQKMHDRWRKAENVTMAFIEESEADAARRNDREGNGTPRYTTIQIPHTYAVLMSAHAYWTSVFFARSPVHQYTGRHGEGEMQINAMEALIGYQIDVGGAMGPYYIWLYDAGKYGGGIVGSYWCREKLHYGQLVEMQGLDGKTTLYQTTQEIDGYIGNKVYNVSPWDFLWDPRVSFKNFQNGEFCAARCRLGWHQIVARQKNGYYNDNVDKIGDPEDKSANEGGSGLDKPVFSRTLYLDDDGKRHPSGGVFWEFYVELIPSEWGVGNTDYPQKWCFTITEDMSTIVGVTPLGLAHCRFPFDVLEGEVEGYGIFSRGIPEILQPMQQTVDWLVNTHFFNVRQTLNNQFIVDPSKLVIRDVQNGGPGFIWRLRPEAYGADLDKIFKQVPVTDVTINNMNDVQQMFGLSERVTGVNDQIMGAVSGGSRKTATEVRTSTSFGVNRQKTITEYMSATGFSSHSQKLVQNSQQLYDATAKLRRVGSYAMEAGQQFLQVSPQDIAGFYDLVPVDGTLPIDRMAQANLWKEMLANVTRMPPAVQMGYDWGRVFAWMANIAGLKNIQQFRIQVLPPGMGPSPGAMPMNGAPGGVSALPGATSATQSGLASLEGQGGPIPAT